MEIRLIREFGLICGQELKFSSLLQSATQLGVSRLTVSRLTRVCEN